MIDYARYQIFLFARAHYLRGVYRYLYEVHMEMLRLRRIRTMYRFMFAGIRNKRFHGLIKYFLIVCWWRSRIRHMADWYWP
jgi:hypothetical protein